MTKTSLTGTKAVFAGMAWLTGGRLAAISLSFVSIAILARLLSPADFGAMAAAMLVIELAGVIFEGTLAANIVQKKIVSRRYIANAFWLAAGMGVLLMLLAMLLAPLIQRFFGFPSLAAMITVASLSLLPRGCASISAALLRRRGAFSTVARTSLLCNLLAYAVIANGLAFAGFGVWSLVMGALCGTAFESLANIWLARIPLKQKFSFRLARMIFTSGGYFFLMQLCNWAARTGANMVIGHRLGAGPLGIYSRGWRLMDLITSATAAPMQNVLFPKFSRMQDDAPRARAAFSKALAVAVPFFAVLSAYVCIHAKAIVLIVLGQKWLETADVVQVLFLALMPRCCYKIAESVSLGFGHARQAAARQAVFAVMMIGGAMLGVGGGPAQVALYISIAVAIYYFMTIVAAARAVNLSFGKVAAIHLRALAAFIIAGALDYAVMALFPGEWFWISQSAGGIVSLLLSTTLFAVIPARWIGDDMAPLREKLFSYCRNFMRSKSA